MVKLPDPPKNIMAQPDKLPLEVLLQKIATDLFIVFHGNGYKKIGFTILAQELDGDQQMGSAGNLKLDGQRAILTNALEALPEEEDAPKIILPRH